MSAERIFQIGDHVVVVDPAADNFDDYDAGDTGVVIESDWMGVNVKWDRRRYASDEMETARCVFVFHRELDLVGEGA